MKLLNEILKNYDEVGNIYYACNLVIPLMSCTKIRMTACSEIYNAEAFHNKHPDLMGVIVDDCGEIPKASKFNTIRTTGTVLFSNEKACTEYFNSHFSTDIVNNTKV